MNANEGIILEGLDPADPYSAVIAGCRRLLDWGFSEEGSMSDEEYKSLQRIEEFIRKDANY